MRVLVTRPLPEAERTADALRALGHEPVMAPLLAIEPIADARIGSGPFAAVLMTSGNAARAIAGHQDIRSLLALDCYAVGSQTALAARAAGFRTVDAADGDGGDLARLIGAKLGDRDEPLLYLAGEDRARDMAAELSPYGLRLELAVVYRALAAQHFAAEIAAALRDGQLDIAMHYSRRSTAIFVDCVRAAGLEAAAAHMTHVCLSASAAEPLAAINVKSILVAQKRDEPSMLALLSAS